MQPLAADSLVLGTMSEAAVALHPYRTPDRVEIDDADHFVASKDHLCYVRQGLALQRWLRVQVWAHVLVLITYGVLLVLLAVMALGATFGVGTICCFAVLASAVSAFNRSSTRLADLWENVPVVGPGEWAHYCFCALLCAGLCSLGLFSEELSWVSSFCLPALVFCFYSIVCLQEIESFSRLRSRRIDAQARFIS
jgi:hypothetical protein